MIFVSDNGRDGWSAVLPADVPDWLKAPAVIARLVAGDQACSPEGGDERWWRAERLESGEGDTKH